MRRGLGRWLGQSRRRGGGAAPPAAPTLTVERDDGGGAAAASQFFTADSTWSFAGESFVFTCALPANATSVSVIGYPDGFGPDDAEAVELASGAGLTDEVVAVSDLAPMADVAANGVTWHVIARATGPGGSTDSSATSVTIDLGTQQVVYFNGNGTYTKPANFMHPDGTRQHAMVVALGSGGGGLLNTGGGGGGGLSIKKVDLSGGESTRAVVVGTVGVDTTGGDTTFGGTEVVAKGGLSRTAGGTGGAAASGTGDTKYSGGGGTTGTGNQSGGGAAGSEASASGATGGAPDGATGQLATEGRRGAGGGSAAGAGRAGGVGALWVVQIVPAQYGAQRLIAYTVGGDTANGTTRNMVIPGGTGGRLNVIASSDGIPTISATGYTALTQRNQAGSAVCLALLHREADGADPVALASSISEAVNWYIERVVTYGGGVPAAPTWTTAEGDSTNADPPSHDSGSATLKRWHAIGAWDGNAAVFTVGASPSGYSPHEIHVPSRGTTLNATRLVVTTKHTSSQTDNPGNFVSDTEQWCAGTASQGDS